MAPGPGRRWAAIPTSSRPRPPRSPTRSSTRSGSPVPSCVAATSVISRPPTRPPARTLRPRPAVPLRPHGGDPMTVEPTGTPESSTPPDARGTLHLARWTATSGSNVRSRGAVVIASGDHEWRASADGNGAIDALYRAVDKALAGVLTGHPRLLSYDIH